MIFSLCNALIQKLKEILTSSLWHLDEIYIIFWNSTHKSFPSLLCGLQATDFNCRFLSIIGKKYILGMIFSICNALIQKLKDILISSLWYIEEIYIKFCNSTHKSFPSLLCGLQATNFNCRFLAINSKMVKIYLTETNYLHYCLMDIRIDR